MFAVGQRPVLRAGRAPLSLVTAHVRRDPHSVVQQIDGALAEAHVDLPTDQRHRGRAVAALDRHVVVQVHPRDAPLGGLGLMGRGRQRLQCGPVQQLEQLAAGRGTLLEENGVDPVAQPGDPGIEFAEAGEGLVPEAFRNASLEQADRSLRLGLDPRATGSGGQHRHVVVPGHLPVRPVDRGLVRMGRKTRDLRLSGTKFFADPPRESKVRACEPIRDFRSWPRLASV